ncbi:MAG TPA: hypothetical protein VFB99_08930, partial [Vicinamibacterales bacterium]|nr:hypothetical protein [Vicinamibacterales bacterium]
MTVHGGHDAPVDDVDTALEPPQWNDQREPIIGDWLRPSGVIRGALEIDDGNVGECSLGQMFKHGTSSVVPVANMLNTFVYKNRTE